MLGHQLPASLPFEAFWDTLPEFFAWFERDIAPTAPERFPVRSDEEVVSAPARNLSVDAREMGILEIIRFAATNRLCVRLDYNEATYLIEPFSLRRTLDGSLILCAIQTDTRECQRYRFDQIQTVEVTDQTFRPQYAIELIVCEAV